MKYLIFGPGFMGNKFKNSLGEEAHLSDLRIKDVDSIKQEIERINPEIIINCAGKTGSPNVDWCEDHKNETLFGNVTVPLLLSKACNDLNKYWVHIGSGCVYAGDNNGKGFSEEDPPNFTGSFYSRTKIWSEAILKEFQNVLILRMRIPIDTESSPKNLIDKLLSFDKVLNIKNSMSVIPNFLRVAKILMDKKKTGIYNLTNPGSITHPEILDMYKEIVDQSFTYKTFSVDELQKITKAERSNCVLNTDKLLKEGVEIPEIHAAVKEILQNMKISVNL